MILDTSAVTRTRSFAASATAKVETGAGAGVEIGSKPRFRLAHARPAIKFNLLWLAKMANGVQMRGLANSP